MKKIVYSAVLSLSLIVSVVSQASAQSFTSSQGKVAPLPAGCYYQPVNCIQAPCPPQLICPTPKPSPTLSPASPKPSPTPVVKCEALTVASGNESTVPATVVLRARIAGDQNQAKKYRFYFGDGKQEEVTNPEITHKYEVSGKFISRVDIQDATGKWLTNNACEATVTVKSSSVESHKSNCSDLYVTAHNNGVVPSTVSLSVSGYDNKGEIKKYKIDLGNGIEKESEGRTFEYVYDKAGTYAVKAYIQDSEGNWKGGEESCKKTITIASKNQAPLTQQPETGSPTVLLISSLAGLGISGVGLTKLRRS